MKSEKAPVTPAVRALRQRKVPFTDHLYVYEDKGGTASGARQLGIDEHCVIKTLVMEDERGSAFVVLMHGDREVSTKSLARFLGVKRVVPCSPETARRHSGYLVGGTSPFGLRAPMPIYVEASILGLPEIYLNGGKRGYLVAMDPRELLRALDPPPITVSVAV